MSIFVGIDPQPDNISFHVWYTKEKPKTILSHMDLTTIDWCKVDLKKRTIFPRVIEWQKYIIQQCGDISNRISDLAVGVNIMEREMNPKIYCAIEQQRGRVASIIEQSLIHAFKLNRYCVDVTTFHPVSWKKATGCACMGANKKNKKAALDLITPELLAYCIKLNVSYPSGRIHDFCDARIINEANLYRLFGSHITIKSQ